jgi:hypothetical protein
MTKGGSSSVSFLKSFDQAPDGSGVALAMTMTHDRIATA